MNPLASPNPERTPMTLTIGSLFSGIGGLELGLEWAGLGPVVFQVEQDEFWMAETGEVKP